MPLDEELCESARVWHQDGRNITGTIISRPSMFELYLTQNKRMRVTSHHGQLLKTATTILGEMVVRCFSDGLEKADGEAPDGKITAFLRQHLRHLETIQVGLARTQEAGEKIDT